MTRRSKTPKKEFEDEVVAPRRRFVRPIVAIVGRPNVGKSTIFNRLARKPIAIVHDEPGVTRDRHYADITVGDRDITLIDTGGLDPESEDPFTEGIRRQIEAAILEADVVLCVLDATQALTVAEHKELDLLRRSKKPIVFAANKADSPRHEAEAMDLYRLGIDKLFPVSALHGRGLSALTDQIEALLPERQQLPSDEAEDRPIRVAILGRPNAGKSSLVNRLLGKERMIVSEVAGTTRDAVDVLVERRGKKYLLIDTAGVRKKARVTKAGDEVESASILQAFRAIERAEVVVLMCDAQEGIADQDAKLVSLISDRSRGLVVALNKCDLLTQTQYNKAEQNARDELAFIPWAPIVRSSAKTGRGSDTLLDHVTKIAGAFRTRIPTGELNRFFEKILATHPPPTHGGRAPRLYYMTQAEASPPLFVLMASDPDKIPVSYQRYVTNQIRKEFGFEGVPIRAKYKARRRRTRP